MPTAQQPVEDKLGKQPEKKLLHQARDTIRLKHYSMSTEQTCVARIKRYILFHNLSQ